MSVTPRPLLSLLPLLGWLGACTGDTGLTEQSATIEVAPASIDFGEVVKGTRADIGVAVRNVGYGPLEITSALLDPLSSSDFQLTQFPGDTLTRSHDGVLGVRYTPDGDGEDHGAVLLGTNDPEHPEVEVPLVGLGVTPVVDIDPERLDFGTVEPPAETTLPLHVGAGGTGDLVIERISFPGAEAVAWSVDLPAEAELPLRVLNGTSLDLSVTFAPPTATPWSGEVWIDTNDPDDPISIVQLFGNPADDTDNDPPAVEIYSPDNGAYYTDAEMVELDGHVIDEDAATSLLCAWYAGDVLLAAAVPDAKGDIAAHATLPAGEVRVKLRCVDSDNAEGTDVAEVTVWDADEPMTYVISGGESPYEYFEVDDDVSFYLNGVAIRQDTDNTSTVMAPVEFEAMPGDVLRIVLTDVNPNDAKLDALELHWGTTRIQHLNDAFCVSSKDTNPCYDPEYPSARPVVAMEQEYVIELP